MYPCIGGDENVLLSLERWLYTDKILTGHNNWIPKYFPLVLVGFYEKDENVNRLDPFSGKPTHQLAVPIHASSMAEETKG